MNHRSPGLCWGMWCPHKQASREHFECSQLSLVPVPECDFSPWKKPVKILRLPEVMRPRQEKGKSLDFLTPIAGRQMNWVCVGKWEVHHSWTHSQIWKSALGFPFSISAIHSFNFDKDVLFLKAALKITDVTHNIFFRFFSTPYPGIEMTGNLLLEMFLGRGNWKTLLCFWIDIACSWTLCSAEFLRLS